jgi:UDP-3-O-[3-hydroxymyristoyl] glucosamine N-acyltransferase
VHLGQVVRIADNAMIADGVTIGSGVILGFGVQLDDDVKLGNAVHIGNDVQLGQGVTIGSSVSLGCEVTLFERETIARTPLAMQGSRHLTTAILPGTIQIGPIVEDADYWRKHYRGIGRINGYTAREVPRSTAKSLSS